MKLVMKILLSLLFLSTLTSCSLFLGGVVYLDNSINVGENEIKLEELSHIHEGKKIVLELNDSTRITGLYESISEFDEGFTQDPIITIYDTNSSVDSINTSDVNKYYYVNEGGSVWFAFAMGAVIDVSMLIMFENNGLGLGGPMIAF